MTIFSTGDMKKINNLSEQKLRELSRILEILYIKFKNNGFCDTVEGRKVLFNIDDSLEYIRKLLANRKKYEKGINNINLNELCGVRKSNKLLRGLNQKEKSV